eukprot:scaffold1954_cov268-Pinguiococcus_pyrenoidosus.AAC.34
MPTSRSRCWSTMTSTASLSPSASLEADGIRRLLSMCRCADVLQQNDTYLCGRRAFPSAVDIGELQKHSLGKDRASNRLAEHEHGDEA